MARLKVMLTENGRTSTVRRQVNASTASDFIEGLLDAGCEVCNELSLPGDKPLQVTVKEGEDDQEDEQENSAEEQEPSQKACSPAVRAGSDGRKDGE